LAPKSGFPVIEIQTTKFNPESTFLTAAVDGRAPGKPAFVGAMITGLRFVRSVDDRARVE